MADAGLAIAVDGVFNDVEADERDETGGDDRDESTDPRGGVDAAIVAEMESDSSGSGGVAEENGEEQSEKKTVAASAFEKIGTSDGEDGAGSVHAATPGAASLRWVARTAR